MGELDDLRARVEALRRGYAGLPRDGWGEPGPIDEETGERWDRGHVLGHVAEMLPFWTAQVRAVVAGSAESMGRDEIGAAQRRMGIDAGREAGEDGLLASVDAGLAGVLTLLGELEDADLERRVVYQASGGERETTVRGQLEQTVVAHAEGHLRQIEELGA
ncbi:MAG TPA: maleylpyruvate isomerase N-terminal domain-containing protein [Candidatus Dormibacteraeota bacterium]